MISYRMLLESDAEAFAQIRLSQLREEGAQETEGVGDAIAEYCREHVPDGSFVAHLALDGEKIIGTCGVSVAHKPPYFQNPGGKIALLSSMYVLPEYRRRGIARTLLEKACAQRKTRGAGRCRLWRQKWACRCTRTSASRAASVSWNSGRNKDA